MRSPATISVLPFEDDADDMVHLPHPDHECADEIETRFFAAGAGELVLGFTVVAADFGDGGEEKMGAVGEPVNPLELRDAGDALERVIPGLEDEVVGHIRRLVVLGAFDVQEGLLDDAEHDVADGFGPVDGAVEVPAAEVEFMGDRVEFVVCQGLVGRCVRLTVALQGRWSAGRYSLADALDRKTYHDRRIKQNVSHSRHILQYHAHPQWPDDFERSV